MLILAFAVVMISSNGSKVFASMQYRSAVKDLHSSLAATRYAAITSGQVKDVEIRPNKKEILINGELRELPSSIELEVVAALELGGNGVGIIRFYPDGSSSGGTIEIRQSVEEDSNGVSIQVDWLMGRVSQQALTAR